MPTTRWKCPTCRRTFVRRNQWHSCQVVPLGVHLDKASPDARKIYEAILGALKRSGPFAAVPTKTGINLLSGTSLGGIRFRKDGVEVGLVFTRKLDHPRVIWSLQISPRTIVHRVMVRSLAEVDAELRAWLKEAYAVGLMAGRRPRGGETGTGSR